MSHAALTTVFGWMSVINLAILIISALSILSFRDSISRLHGRMFAIEPADVRIAYFKWLAAYKLLIFVFAIVPWLALTLA